MDQRSYGVFSAFAGEFVETGYSEEQAHKRLRALEKTGEYEEGDLSVDEVCEAHDDALAAECEGCAILLDDC